MAVAAPSGPGTKRISRTASRQKKAFSERSRRERGDGSSSALSRGERGDDSLRLSTSLFSAARV
jgi:hypothetical protein